MKETPKQFLDRLKNSTVRIILKWGEYYEGILVQYDKYYNILLGECTEYIGEGSVYVGEMLIRCNNIKVIQEINNINK